MLSLATRSRRLAIQWLPQSAGAWAIAATTILGAVGLSIAIGFIGAPHDVRFAWALMAEVGTALGTLLLAGYTAWLATTTRQEVGLAIAEQRARDRPVIIATRGEIGAAPLDATIGALVPVLNVRLRNIGVGPARDLTVRATAQANLAESDVPVAWTEEFRAAWTVDQDDDVALSLARFVEPEAGFRAADFHIEGTYHDRRKVASYDIEVEDEYGLRDEQREAARLALSRASLAFSSGMPGDVTGHTITYHPQVLNNGQGPASNVELRFLRSEDGQLFETPFEVPDVGPRSTVNFDVELPLPHPWLSAQLSWNDPLSFKVGPPFERVYPARASASSPGS